jgi:hypothetical protein
MPIPSDAGQETHESSASDTTEPLAILGGVALRVNAGPDEESTTSEDAAVADAGA